MPSFLTGRVLRILDERPGLQRVEVQLDGESSPSRALNYPELIGHVAIGDEVVCNTTAVELGLGTGGWHFVHWNLGRKAFLHASGGHIMKMRYTSLQLDVRAVEEEGSVLQQAMLEREGVGGMPVVVASLHSLVAAIAAGVKAAGPDLRVAYVMTDGAALALALSDLVASLREAGLIDVTVTAGHAFGGDHEAVNAASAVVAANVEGADVAICAMGPGVVGTSTRFGSTAWEVAGLLDTVLAVGGRPVVALRCSEADFRMRHQGVSHHTLTALTKGATGAALPREIDVVVPAIGGAAQEAIEDDLTLAGVPERYRMVEVDAGDALERLAAAGVAPTSMGRTVGEDPVFWQAGAAAGVHAAHLATQV